jgi:hypothetical protein
MNEYYPYYYQNLREGQYRYQALLQGVS